MKTAHLSPVIDQIVRKGAETLSVSFSTVINLLAEQTLQKVFKPHELELRSFFSSRCSKVHGNAL